MFMDESAFDDFKDIEDNIPEIDGAGSSRPETASSKNSGMMAGEDTNTYSRHGNRPTSARPQSAAAAAKRGKPPTGPPPGQGADPLAGEADPKPNNNQQAELGSAGALPSSATSRARVLAQQREMLMKRRTQNRHEGMMRSNDGPLAGDQPHQTTAAAPTFSAPRSLADDPFGSNKRWGGDDHEPGRGGGGGGGNPQLPDRGGGGGGGGDRRTPPPQRGPAAAPPPREGSSSRGRGGWDDARGGGGGGGGYSDRDIRRDNYRDRNEGYDSRDGYGNNFDREDPRRSRDYDRGYDDRRGGGGGGGGPYDRDPRGGGGGGYGDNRYGDDRDRRGGYDRDTRGGGGGGGGYDRDPRGGSGGYGGRGEDRGYGGRRDDYDDGGYNDRGYDNRYDDRRGGGGRDRGGYDDDRDRGYDRDRGGYDDDRRRRGGGGDPRGDPQYDPRDDRRQGGGGRGPDEGAGGPSPPPAAAAAAEPASVPARSPAEFNPDALDLSDMRRFLMEPVAREAGIVQCSIVRNKSGTNKLFPNYQVFMKYGDQERFLLAGKKRAGNKTSNYLISMQEGDLSRESRNFLGKLRANFVGTEFQVYDDGVNPKDLDAVGASADQARRELGVVLYASNMLGSRGPRKMQVFVPQVDPQGRAREFRPASGREGDMLGAVKREDLTDLIYLINKPPRWNDEVGAYVLNFNGRVTMASVKNFQLIEGERPEDVLLQFGRVAKDKFTMDFQWPLSPFQAFAITLSSFDSKIACD